MLVILGSLKGLWKLALACHKPLVKEANQMHIDSQSELVIYDVEINEF